MRGKTFWAGKIFQTSGETKCWLSELINRDQGFLLCLWEKNTKLNKGYAEFGKSFYKLNFDCCSS